MSIAPPSDIILDVAQAADPQRLQAATSKLNTMATSSGGESVDFATLLAGAGHKSWSPGGVGAAPPTTYTPHAGGSVQAMSPYRKFEAVLLQTFVQEMLPKDDALYGGAASGDAYRSMMAEQLADQLAKSGRIGIARMIEKAHGPGTPGAAAPAVPGSPTIPGSPTGHDAPAARAPDLAASAAVAAPSPRRADG